MYIATGMVGCIQNVCAPARTHTHTHVI